MKRILVILLICLLATTAFGQWSGIKPMLGRQVDKSHQLGDMVGFWPMPEGSGS